MALKKCKECGKEISSSAKKCPSCGKDQRNWFVRHKVLTLIIIIFVVIGIAEAGGSSTSDTASTSSSKSDTKVEKQTETAMTYEEVNTTTFIKAFDDNQLSAEKQYKDKGVQLKAKIKNISEDIVGSPFLSLEPASAGEYYFGTTIKCEFENSDDLLDVSNEQTVVIKGIVGEQSLGIINIKECQIVNQ